VNKIHIFGSIVIYPQKTINNFIEFLSYHSNLTWYYDQIYHKLKLTFFLIVLILYKLLLIYFLPEKTYPCLI